MSRVALKVLPSPTSPALAQEASPMSPEDLRVFGVVAESGGIRSAAKVLGLPKSTVSRHLTQLERSVGSRLVTRTTRRFELTELGRRLAAQAGQLRQLLDASQRIVEQNTTEPSGVLRIAASPIVGDELLPEPVCDYLTKYPGTRIDLELSNDYVDLRTGKVDMAIRTGELDNSSDVYATRLGTSEKGHFASRAYLKKHGVPEDPMELVSHRCIVVGRPTREGWSFATRGGSVFVPLSFTLRVDSHRLARAAAVAGAGLARLPTFYAKPLVDSGELVQVLQRFSPRFGVFAVHTYGVPAPPKIRAFTAMLKTVFAKRLG